MFTKVMPPAKACVALTFVAAFAYLAYASADLLETQQARLSAAVAHAPLLHVWNRINHTSSTLDLPPCKKTVLFAFSRTAGFGSSFGIYVRTGLWAKHHDYALLVATLDDWAYGDFADYFHQPVLTCTPATDAYEPKKRKVVGSAGWEDQSHLLMVRGAHEHIDRWILERYIDLDDFSSLSQYDTHVEPLPQNMTTPSPVFNAFKDLHQQFLAVWRPKPELDGMVQGVIRSLKLERPRSQRPPVIGLHYRGGDKFRKECTHEDGCGNTSTYLTAALQTRDQLTDRFCTGCRPVLAIMTVEPDAYDLFKADPLSKDFDMQLLPPPADGLHGHTQREFNQQDREQIIENTMIMLRDITVLAIHADAFIVTASSNVGRISVTLGGPDRIVRSIDKIYSPTTKPLQYYADERRTAFSRMRRRRRRSWVPFHLSGA